LYFYVILYLSLTSKVNFTKHFNFNQIPFQRSAINHKLAFQLLANFKPNYTNLTDRHKVDVSLCNHRSFFFFDWTSVITKKRDFFLRVLLTSASGALFKHFKFRKIFF